MIQSEFNLNTRFSTYSFLNFEFACMWAILSSLRSFACTPPLPWLKQSMSVMGLITAQNTIRTHGWHIIASGHTFAAIDPPICKRGRSVRGDILEMVSCLESQEYLTRSRGFDKFYIAPIQSIL